MTGFDTVIMIDWSGGNDTGPRPRKDAIWAGITQGGIDRDPVYLRNRALAEAWITATLDAEAQAGRRVCLGFDFAFAFPAGFAAALTGDPDPLALWDWVAARIEDTPRRNNRFDLAATINRGFPGHGPFWFNGLARDIPDLPRKGRERTFRWQPERRATERAAKGSFACWQLGGAGAVGSQVLTGMPVLARLRARHGARLGVWPFEAAQRQITLLEVWPSLITPTIAALAAEGEIRDRAQMRILARAIAALPHDRLAAMLDRPADPEGWIFGVGHEEWLKAAAGAEVSR